MKNWFCWPFLFVVRVFLYPCAVVRYFFLRQLCRRRRSSAQVISVGNVVFGGSGKTPLIERLLCDLPGKLGYVSRGYGRKGNGPYRTTSPSCDVEKSGDEAAQLALHTKGVWISVGASKWKALCAIEKDCDCVIVDDALQRYDIPADFHVATVSAAAPYGNPRGLMREPFFRLRSVDLIVVTDAQKASPSLKRRLLSYHRPIVWTVPAITSFFRPDGTEVTFHKGQEMALFSGIANPERFSRSLEALGFVVVDHLKGADHGLHDRFSLFSWMNEVWRKHPSVIFVGTEKDFVRRADWGALPVHFARMELRIVEGREAYEAFVTKASMSC